MRELTENEVQIVNLLAEVWNRFIELNVAHSNDRTEMASAIHAAQNIILARPATEQMSKPPATSPVDNAPLS